MVAGFSASSASVVALAVTFLSLLHQQAATPPSVKGRMGQCLKSQGLSCMQRKSVSAKVEAVEEESDAEVESEDGGGNVKFEEVDKKMMQQEDEEVDENGAGQAMLATKKSTAKHTTLPGHAKHCNANIVKAACYEFTGNSSMSIFTPAHLADAFNTDLSSSEALLAFLRLNRSSIACNEFCRALLDAIPEQSRPPAPQVGPRLTDHSTVWDEDLSDAILEGLKIADEPPDKVGSELIDRKAALLQQKVDLLHEHKNKDVPQEEMKEDVPHEEAKEATANFPVAVPDFLRLAAEAFQIYAIWNSPLGSEEQKVGLVEQASFNCNKEAIWDNGAEYIGCQTQTVGGKQCMAWKNSKKKKFQHLPSNFCRNPDGEPRLWCFTKGTNRGFCEPKGAPDGFTLAQANVVLLAQSWMSESLKHFNAYHLPAAYEKWLGPSEVRRKGVTNKGCTCRKSWKHSGKQIKEYCGNPDNDAGGPWCLVTKDATGETCQGRDWGYCAKSTDLIYTKKGCACKKKWTYKGQETITDYCGNPNDDPEGAWCVVQDKKCQGSNWGTCNSLCGPECQEVRSKLQRTNALLSKLAVKYDDSSDAYGYITGSTTDMKQVDTINVLGSNHIEDT